MKREIKFRVWKDEPKKMVYDDMLFINGASDGGTASLAATIFNLQQEYILMQFTGRDDADINGEEVYEGDIIENCDTKELQIVYWNESEAAWYCRYIHYEKERIVSLADSLGNLNKVIGNIYENSELIKQTT